MYFFCTLFDTNYLSRGLALYESLKRCFATQFKLYIFPFDSTALSILKSMRLSQAEIIPQSDFENEDLLVLKQNRTQGEYCWTCTPGIIEYAIKHFSLPHCIYLDADIYFYDSPEQILKQIHNDDVMITEHRYSPQYDQSKTVGRFCVQFMYFKNTQNGLNILEHWKQQCIEWCYDRIEPGRFGDQKYLDVWPKKYHGVHIPIHFGVGAAPWNIQQYHVSSLQRQPYLYDSRVSQMLPVIFYHFHGLKFLGKNKIDLGGYRLNQSVIQNIYKPYLNHLKSIEQRLHREGFDYNIHGISSIKKTNSFLTILKRKIKCTYNVISISSYEFVL